MFSYTSNLLKNIIFRAISVIWSGREANSFKAALICPPAYEPGSLGDEAMIKALIHTLKDNGFNKFGVLESPGSTSWAKSLCSATSINAPNSSFLGWIEFSIILRRYSHVFVIGADCIDGKYSIFGSRRLLRLAHFSAIAGKVSTITGCSFNEAGIPSIIDTIRMLDSRVRFLARDPRSQSRLNKISLHDIELVSDLAFMLKPDSTRVGKSLGWIHAERKQGRTIMGINLGPTALVSKDADTIFQCISAFSRALEHVLKHDSMVSIVLLPHDTRGELSDLTMCEKLQSLLPEYFSSRIILFNDDFSAESIKAVASALDVCITSRMHLAIACLGSGVPVGAITYQDKFEGLFDLMHINPSTILGKEAVDDKLVLQLIESTLIDAPLMKNRIVESLDRILDFSKKNIPH